MNPLWIGFLLVPLSGCVVSPDQNTAVPARTPVKSIAAMPPLEEDEKTDGLREVFRGSEDSIESAPPTDDRPERWGRFEGRVVAEWLNDGRQMKLVEPFSFIDPRERRWMAPAGAQINGASIPKFAWSFVGGPYEGLYRDASVIHDVACDPKHKYLNATWQQAHEMFYRAVRARGANPITAKLMYAAVYHFGPRWPEKTVISGVNEWQIRKLRASATAANPDAVVSVRGSNIPPFRGKPEIRSSRSFDQLPRVLMPDEDLAQAQYERDVYLILLGGFPFAGISGPDAEELAVTITVETPRSIRSQKQFQQLRRQIVEEDISLEQIRRFKPS